MSVSTACLINSSTSRSTKDLLSTCSVLGKQVLDFILDGFLVIGFYSRYFRGHPDHKGRLAYPGLKKNRKSGHLLLFSMKFYCLNKTHGQGRVKRIWV